MTRRPAKAEWIVVGACLVIGTILRCWHLDRESVEHFDEGVYASVLWYDGVYGPQYPAREFFAPPGLPWMIEAASLIPGSGRFAPFLPSLCFGIASIAVFWWLGRSWFGTVGGVVAAIVVAMSDFHIQYSRMALTDVPVLFWIALSVGLGVQAIDRQSVKWAVAAGIACGIAWWIKYTGWLPLAIVSSGSVLWWILNGRKRQDVRLGKSLFILGVMILAAFVTFSPWWIHLQSVGGYSRITAHHRSFAAAADSLVATWRKNMTDQLSFQLFQDGIFGVLSLGLGVLWAAWIRWNAAVRSTWNEQANASLQANSSGQFFPPGSLAIRFIVAAFALVVLALRIRTPLMMLCMALGGFAGMHLWPVLHRAWQRRRTNDLSPTAPDAIPLTQGDLDVAATTDPSLAFSILVCWFSGLLLVTPLYHPYARLFFPLLASIWLSAAAGVSWWLESNLSVARRGTAAPKPSVLQSIGQRIVTAMVAGAVIASFVQFNQDFELEVVPLAEIAHVAGYEERRSIEVAADSIADSCVASARGDLDDNRAGQVPIGDIIYPGKILRSQSESVPEAAATDEEPSTVEPSNAGSDNPQSPKPQSDSKTATPKYSIEQRQSEKLIVYVYGDPALLLHLNQAGLTAVPVSHLNLRGPNGDPPAPRPL